MKEIDIDFEKLKKETGYDFLKNGEYAKIDFFEFLACWAWQLTRTIDNPNANQKHYID